MRQTSKLSITLSLNVLKCEVDLIRLIIRHANIVCFKNENSPNEFSLKRIRPNLLPSIHTVNWSVHIINAYIYSNYHIAGVFNSRVNFTKANIWFNLKPKRRNFAFEMDPEAFLDMANQVIKLKMFPYFDIAHSLLCALAVREDLGAGAQAFSRKHPLACWLSTMLVIFSGGMVANGLLGEPILAPLKNSPQLYVATVVWYLVFYTPFDIGYKVRFGKLFQFFIILTS